MNKNLLYRSIPKVDLLLEKEEIKVLIGLYGRELVMEAIHIVMHELRAYIGRIEDSPSAESATAKTGSAAAKAEGAAGKAGSAEAKTGSAAGTKNRNISYKIAQEKIENICGEVEACVNKLVTPNMKPVINATGTILHTNLGRALISEKHAKRLMDIVTGYSNLEYNLEAGKRGERYSHFEKLLCKITGAEAAMAVNNNAAAVMLVLSSMAKGGEVIVSRGELVEIGGKFRVPDVMEQSGAILREVGTTNKTHFSDYEEAVTENTKAFLKVHTSNYRIIGFTESVPVAELAELSKETSIPVIEDLGSGVLVDLSKYGLTYEPTVQDSIRAGADVVCFSGDKLLGGPQAGIIIGKKKYIDLMKKNQLTRALRIDKFTAAALELVFTEYLCEEKAVENIPVLRMIREPLADVSARAERLKAALCEKLAVDGTETSEKLAAADVAEAGVEPAADGTKAGEKLAAADVAEAGVEPAADGTKASEKLAEEDVAEAGEKLAADGTEASEKSVEVCIAGGNAADAHEKTDALNRNTIYQGVLSIDLETCESQIGGGSLPLERIPSMALAIKPAKLSVNEMEEAMRGLEIPIIGRTYNDKIYLDMRTVPEKQVEVIAKELAGLFG